MAHLILTGATGLVGSAALAHILSLPAGKVVKVSILSRRPVPMAEGKPNVDVIIQKDFKTYDSELLQKLKGASGCVWAQGISATQVSKEEYKRITIDYPVSAAKAFSSLSDSFNFVYVSGNGATTTPGMFTPFFGKVKGQAELELFALSETTPSLKVLSVRPGAVDDTNHSEVIAAMGSRNVPIVNKVAKAALFPALRTLTPGIVAPTEELGKFLVDLALSDGAPLKGSDITDGRIIENKAFRRIIKEGSSK